MADNKTQPTDASPQEFINALEDERQREDSAQLIRMMEAATGKKAVMWGPSIIGFGQYEYKYASGREGEWMEVGFSPRKRNISLYLMGGLARQQALLDKLGRYKTGKSCLYVNKLADIDLAVLDQMIRNSVQAVRAGEIRF